MIVWQVIGTFAHKHFSSTCFTTRKEALRARKPPMNLRAFREPEVGLVALRPAAGDWTF